MKQYEFDMIKELTAEQISHIVEAYGPDRGASVIVLGLSACVYLPLGVLIGWLFWG